MKVIISMAGNGSRFKQAINEEKYKLQIKEQTMFEYALESFELFLTTNSYSLHVRNMNPAHLSAKSVQPSESKSSKLWRLRD